MNVQSRRKYDREFKRDAILATKEPGRTVRDITWNLSIEVDLLYQWRRQLPNQGGTRLLWPRQYGVHPRSEAHP